MNTIINNLFYYYSCDNHYIIEAKEAAEQGKLVIEFKAEKGHENKMFIDEREKQRERVLQQSAWEDDSESDEDFKMPPRKLRMDGCC